MYDPCPTALRVGHLHKLSGTVLRGRILHFPPLIYLTMYCYQDGFQLVTLGCNLVLVYFVIQVVQLWPWGAPPKGSWDPPAGPPWRVCIFRALPYFRELQDARLTWRNPCPSAGTSPFPRELWSLSLENNIGNQHLASRCACCFWSVVVSRPHQLMEQGNVCVHVHVCVYNPCILTNPCTPPCVATWTYVDAGKHEPRARPLTVGQWVIPAFSCLPTTSRCSPEKPGSPTSTRTHSLHSLVLQRLFPSYMFSIFSNKTVSSSRARPELVSLFLSSPPPEF